jgi:hypothetical protein
MKTPDGIIEFRHRYAGGESGSTFTVGEDLAAQLPKLALPTMSEEARAAFRAVLAYETRTSSDMFALVEARGFTAHPCDYIPEFRWQFCGRHSAIYQPWTDWLSEHEITKFHSGNMITPKNYRRFPKSQRHGPIKHLIRLGKDSDFAEIKAIAEANPASARAELAADIYAWGSFDGCYPWQVPLLEYFARDPSDKVRIIAQTKLEKMGEFTTVEAHARVIAEHLMVTADRVSWKVPPEHPSGFLFRNFASVTFEALAEALGLTSAQLAERADLIDFKMSNFYMPAGSAGLEARAILAARALDLGLGGESIPLVWFEGAEPGLWRRGLEAMKASPYVNSVQEHLGDKTGTMSLAELREWDAWEHMRISVTRQVKERKLPVNISYDPLRYLAKIIDKEAAQAVLDEALSLGMKPDNPRLTMLRLNLAL